MDGRRIFVGSFNFDPRSARLNTEMGLLVDSPALARAVAAAFDERIPLEAYEVRLDEHGALYWIERGPAGTERFDTEPDTRWSQRALVRVLSWLPIEWLL